MDQEETAQGLEGDSSATANRALLLVSFAVMLSTAVWFSGTASASTLQELWNLSTGESAWLTISVQIGFILGTFLYSILNLPDIFNPRRVYFFSALTGALFNLFFALFSNSIYSASVLRLLTGITLAGIYPVGMKIVASWFRQGLGWRLGVLIAALTAGKGTSYLLQTLSGVLDWRTLVSLTSAGSLIGGVIVLTALRDGPHLKRKAPFDVSIMFKVFRNPAFRYTAFGYFGHMWELYAFWSLIGFYIASSTGAGKVATSALSFLALASGVVGCLVAGRISNQLGERKVALYCLIGSGVCCLISAPASYLPVVLILPLIVLWGMLVIGDSAQFSALAAHYCPPEYTGTALTVQNGIGFGITIPSIQLLSLLAEPIGWQYVFMLLAVGPAVGVLYMMRLGRLENRPYGV